MFRKRPGAPDPSPRRGAPTSLLVFVKHLLELCLISAHKHVDLFPVKEDLERWHSTNVTLRCDVFRFVNINLDENQRRVFGVFRELYEVGTDSVKSHGGVSAIVGVRKRGGADWGSYRARSPAACVRRLYSHAPARHSPHHRNRRRRHR